MHWRRKWQPTPVLLPGESQERGRLVGCRLWGCTESDTTEVTQQQCTLSRARILYEQLCFCVLYCTALYGVQEYSSFISSPGCPKA